MIYFSDVDVVWKLAECGFLPELPQLLGIGEGVEAEIQYLVSLRARLSRPSKRLTDPVRQQELADFCARYRVMQGAGDLARQEQMQKAGMDPGEALLFAEAEAIRGIVVTGDKRALEAYFKVSSPAQRGRVRVVCWEQLLLRVHGVLGFERLSRGCCAALHCDKLLQLVFSNGPATPEAHAVEGLKSYLGGVRAHSGDILADLGV